mmetsp:Transcript_21492/g.47207  ORF Transcript_21492/g.47207 Transcript_21492/m.47207 type:complete len:382 (-) Transcript_21492:832-1977(-)
MQAGELGSGVRLVLVEAGPQRLDLRAQVQHVLLQSIHIRHCLHRPRLLGLKHAEPGPQVRDLLLQSLEEVLGRLLPACVRVIHQGGDSPDGRGGRHPVGQRRDRGLDVDHALGQGEQGGRVQVGYGGRAAGDLVSELCDMGCRLGPQGRLLSCRLHLPLQLAQLLGQPLNLRGGPAQVQALERLHPRNQLRLLRLDHGPLRGSPLQRLHPSGQLRVLLLVGHGALRGALRPGHQLLLLPTLQLLPHPGLPNAPRHLAAQGLHRRVQGADLGLGGVEPVPGGLDTAAQPLQQHVHFRGPPQELTGLVLEGAQAGRYHRLKVAGDNLNVLDVLRKILQPVRDVFLEGHEITAAQTGLLRSCHCHLIHALLQLLDLFVVVRHLL